MHSPDFSDSATTYQMPNYASLTGYSNLYSPNFSKGVR